MERHALTPPSWHSSWARRGGGAGPPAKCRASWGWGVSRALVGSLRGRSVVPLGQQAPRAQLSISQTSSSPHSSRRAVVIQHPRAPTTRIGQVNGAPPTRLPHTRRATGIPRSHFAASNCPAVPFWQTPSSLPKLARKHQKSPVDSPNVRRSHYGDTHFAHGYVLDRIVPTPFPAQTSRGIRGPTAVSQPDHETSRACPTARPGLRPGRHLPILSTQSAPPTLGGLQHRLSRLRRP